MVYHEAWKNDLTIQLTDTPRQGPKISRKRHSSCFDVHMSIFHSIQIMDPKYKKKRWGMGGGGGGGGGVFHPWINHYT